ncbi:MAG: FIST C-terminal domain-containing protein [Candidatus Omnitrophica bacterium]|nr:FIST C-terminal domain-containing protein [Candidatus Omnitrophota bacterium]
MRIGVGASSAQDYIKAVKEAVEKARANIANENIDFALVFSTEKFNHPLVLQTITGLLGPIPVLGANSRAVISTVASLKHGLVIILFCLSKNMHFNIAGVDNITTDSLTAGEILGEKLLRGFTNVRRIFSIIFTNADTLNSQNLILGLQERVGKSFPLAGGSIINRGEQKNNSLSLNQVAMNDGAWGIIWGEKLNFSIVTKHGWQPIGKPRQITKASGNTVIEIDNRPAVNLYKEYFAQDTAELENNLERLRTFYPLGISTGEKKEFLLRSILSIGPDGSLEFLGDVPEGSMVRLMIGSKEACLASTQEAAGATIKNMGRNKIKFAMVLNSLSRFSLLGRMANQEVKIIKNILGDDIPFAGIYTSTEQAPLNTINYLGKTYFHNNSITILAIAE